MPVDDASGDKPQQSSPSDGLAVDRKQAEQRRLASLSRLSRGVAHDFNNFLMVILGQAEIGLLTSAADSPARAQFDQIRTASLRAAELCRQLMAYAGRAPLSLATINLADLLTEIVAEVRPSLNLQCELRCDFSAAQLPPIEADKPQLRAVMIGALRNACEALLPAGGVISVTASTMDADQAYLQKLRPTNEAQPGPFVCVEIADNGSGMDEATLASSFDPFYTTKKARPGMGLPTLWGIVRSHRGAVHVESIVGQGTTLRILLPVARDSQALAERLRHLLKD